MQKKDNFHEIANKLTILKLIFEDFEDLDEEDFLEWKKIVSELEKNFWELRKK